MENERIDDETLQRFLDRELPEAEHTAVQRRVDASTEDRARLARLRRVGHLVRLAAADLAKPVGEPQHADALFARIEAQVDRRSRLSIHPGGGRVGRALAAGAMITAMAAAVMLAVVLREPARPTIEARTPDAVELPPPGSEVVAVEFGHSTGTVFEVEGPSGQPLAVVWIDDPESIGAL
jgi:anti-sigma factor RsiW